MNRLGRKPVESLGTSGNFQVFRDVLGIELDSEDWQSWQDAGL